MTAPARRDTRVPPAEMTDRELARRLGDAQRILARIEAQPRPRQSTVATARTLAEELRIELGQRLVDGRFAAWDLLGVFVEPTTRSPQGGGTVYHERHRSRWVAEITVDGTRTRKIAPTREDAEAWLRDFRMLHLAGLEMEHTERRLRAGLVGERVSAEPVTERRLWTRVSDALGHLRSRLGVRASRP